MADNDGMNLVANVMGAMLNDAHANGQTLIEMKDQEIARLRAELNVVRSRVSFACSKPYAPSTAFLLKVLYPSRDEVTHAVESGMGEWARQTGSKGRPTRWDDSRGKTRSSGRDSYVDMTTGERSFL